MDFFPAFAFFALGAIAGSFAGVIAERIYTGQSWRAGRSRCNACDRALGIPDLVPVLSWLVSRGRCRVCTSRIPAAYLLLEVALGALFLFAYLQIGPAISLAPFLLAVFLLAVIVLYDLRHMVVPVPLSLMAIGLALLYTALASPDTHALGVALFTAGAIALFLFLLYALSGGRMMGLGDTPVALALSLLLGPLALSGLLFSFWIGGVIGIFILSARPQGRRMGVEVPFVPFLAAGYTLAFLTAWNLLPLIGF